MGAYCESKLANLLFSNELQERLQRHNGLQNVRKHLLLVMLRQLPLRGGCSVVSVANGRTNRTATACVADTTAVTAAHICCSLLVGQDCCPYSNYVIMH